MSYLDVGNSAAGADVETLTGDSGGAVPPTGGNIDVVSGSGISIVGNPATSTLTVSGTATVPLSFDCDTGSATPAANALTVAGGTDIATTGSGDTVTIDFTGTTGLTWVEVGGTSQAISVETGYIAANAGATVTFTLPSSASQGERFKIVGNAAGGWEIAQNASQTISMLGSSTTTGVVGNFAADEATACVEILCVTDDVDFRVINSVGNFTLT